MGIVVSAAFTLSAIANIEDAIGDYDDIDLHRSGAGWVIFAAGVGIIAESIITILRLVGVVGENLTVFGIVVSLELHIILKNALLAILSFHP